MLRRSVLDVLDIFYNEQYVIKAWCRKWEIKLKMKEVAICEIFKNPSMYWDITIFSNFDVRVGEAFIRKTKSCFHNWMGESFQNFDISQFFLICLFQFIQICNNFFLRGAGVTPNPWSINSVINNDCPKSTDLLRH